MIYPFEIVVACDLNGAIGQNQRIPWHIPQDLKHFQSITQDHTIVMGRKTWESLPSKPLKNRRHIVISSQDQSSLPWDIIHLKSPQTLIDMVTRRRYEATKPIFIIGGEKIYQAFLPYTRTIHYTKVFTRVEGADAHFKTLDQLRVDQFRLDECHTPVTHMRQAVPYAFMTLKRRREDLSLVA